MISKNHVKHIQSLRLAKFRKAHGEFVAEGVKIVEEMLLSPFRVTGIFALDTWIEKNRNILSQDNIPIIQVTEAELEKISGLVSPHEVLATVAIPQPETLPVPGAESLVLLLDRIQDPGNLGTIIRTADWFGIRTVCCSDDCADVYNPKVVQATMGSISRVKVFYGSMGSFIEQFRSANVMIYGAMASGDPVYQTELTFPAALMAGNESAGISPEWFPGLDARIGIPGGISGAESLNAAIAVGILCSEFVRRPGFGRIDQF
jgi:TrmH family RNA methyltransferase